MKTSVQISQLETPSTWHGILSYAKVYAELFSVAILHMRYNLYLHPFALLTCVVFIAGRQHSLYILNHDAGHGSLFKTKTLNRWISTALSIVPMWHHPEAWSYVQWKRIHRLHHGYLFTDNDPNFVSRIRSGDTEKPINVLTLIKLCLLSMPRTVYAFFFLRQDHCPPASTRFEKNKIPHIKALLHIMVRDSEMAIEQIVKIACYLITGLLFSFNDLWFAFFVFWVIPMYTVYPMILTYFDLTEHYWSVPSQDIKRNTHSKKHGFIAQMIVSQLPRGLHREHHLFPRVRSALLPKLKVFLNKQEREHSHAG